MSVRTLAKISFVGAAGCMVLNMGWKLYQNNRVKSSTQYFNAMEIMQESKDVTDLLGKDITAGYINVGDRQLNGFDDKMAWYTVPVKGQSGAGQLYFVISKVLGEEGRAKLSKVAFMDSKDPGSVIVLKDDSVSTA